MDVQARIEELEQSAADAELLALLIGHDEGKVKCSRLAEDFRIEAAALRASTIPLTPTDTSFGLT
jgi:hypothetical protein